MRLLFIIFITVVGVLIESSFLFFRYTGLKVPFFLASIIFFSLIFHNYYTSLTLGIIWGGITSLFSNCKIPILNLFTYPIVGVGVVWLKKRLRENSKVILIAALFLSFFSLYFVNLMHFIFCYSFSSLLFFLSLSLKESILLMLLVESSLLFFLLGKRKLHSPLFKSIIKFG